MSACTIVTAAGVEPARLDAFLTRAYGPEKSEFLRLHGRWWHHGDENRLVVVRGDEIAGYCAVIPTRCRVDGVVHDAVWWVDLIVLPEFRGQGLQHMLDEALRARVDLKLGFPNPLAAKMHRKHGWGVREDFRALLLPLAPRATRIVRTAEGAQGALLRAGAALLTPAAGLFRRRLARYQPVHAAMLATSDPELLAAIFARHQRADVVTTARDAEFLRWRYLEAPYRDALAFYTGGGAPSAPSVALVARTLPLASGTLVRVLDLFGDLDDAHAVRDVVGLCLRDAARGGAVQVTALATVPRLRALLRSLGFVASSTARFCWHSHVPALLDRLWGECWFTLGDSDNDDLG
jgi:GNAT superfamily N-acetyltransferase